MDFNEFIECINSGDTVTGGSETHLFVFLYAIHNKVKENHQYIAKVAYVMPYVNTDGGKKSCAFDKPT